MKNLAPVPPMVERLPWLNIGLRTLLALAGAYGVASLVAATLALALPMKKLDATMTAIMVGFLAQLIGVLWVYAARTVARATLGLLVPALLFGAWLIILLQGAGS